MESVADIWGTTPTERDRAYPCDEHIAGEAASLYRGVSIDAPPAVVFRWLCQMRVAPYSYDWIDNLGRRSPRTLTPGLEDLAIGQTVMVIFTIKDFARDEHLTLELASPYRRIMGPGLISYTVEPTGSAADATRLLVKVTAPAPHGLLAKGVWRALAWGDLIMMRKQLLTFRELAAGTWSR